MTYGDQTIRVKRIEIFDGRQQMSTTEFVCRSHHFGDHGPTLWDVTRPQQEERVFLPYHAFQRADVS